MANKGTAASGELANGTEQNDFSTANYSTHPAWVRVQHQIDIERPKPFEWIGKGGKIMTIPGNPHRFDPCMPSGALLRSVLIYLIKSDGQASRATAIKEVSRKAGFTASDVRGVINWLIDVDAAYQIATAESTVTVRLIGEADDEVF